MDILVCVAEGWGGRRVCVYPCAVLGYAMLRYSVGVGDHTSNNKASPPGRHQEQAPKQRCTFRPTTFSSVQFVYHLSMVPVRVVGTPTLREPTTGAAGLVGALSG